jgi:2-deoxy-D-gluconate 3-dehydrogenase
MSTHMTQLFDLRDRVALVTGGNGGLGLGMALGLARAGASVVIAARRQDKADAALARLREINDSCLFVPLNVSSEEAMWSMAAGSRRGMSICWKSSGGA